MNPISAMVVDDSGIMRKLVMRAITESKLAEFLFTEAADGADALAKFNPETTQMLFVDWNMPNMNGIDFIRKIRAIEKKHTPVVMITTERTVGKVEEAMESAGVDAYICKPFTAPVLTEKLRPLVRKLREAEPPPPAPGGFFSKLVNQLA
jgi:two-component system chemotaxis response regulator CheY